jgi:hypothetical protein
MAQEIKLQVKAENVTFRGEGFLRIEKLPASRVPSTQREAETLIDAFHNGGEDISFVIKEIKIETPIETRLDHMDDEFKQDIIILYDFYDTNALSFMDGANHLYKGAKY